jgi:propionyl-CoA synthetase
MIVGSGFAREPMTGYAGTYRRSIEQPEEFWAEAAEAIDWDRGWDRVLDATGHPLFAGSPVPGSITCWNAVDRHVAAGNRDRVALIWDSPVTGQV